MDRTRSLHVDGNVSRVFSSSPLCAAVVWAVSSFFTIGCAASVDEASKVPSDGAGAFDPTTPTGGVVEPGSATPVEPSADMEQVSFEDGESAGPAEHIRGAPEREDIPSFKLFGTHGEGPG